MTNNGGGLELAPGLRPLNPTKWSQLCELSLEHPARFDRAVIVAPHFRIR